MLLRSHIAIKNYKEFPERSIWSGPICNNVACLHRRRLGLWAPGRDRLDLILIFETWTSKNEHNLDLPVMINDLKSEHLTQVIMDKPRRICNLQEFSNKIDKSFSACLTLRGCSKVTTGADFRRFCRRLSIIGNRTLYIIWIFGIWKMTSHQLSANIPP